MAICLSAFITAFIFNSQLGQIVHLLMSHQLCVARLTRSRAPSRKSARQ